MLPPDKQSLPMCSHRHHAPPMPSEEFFEWYQLQHCRIPCHPVHKMVLFSSGDQSFDQNHHHRCQDCDQYSANCVEDIFVFVFFDDDYVDVVFYTLFDAVACDE